jgi:hypothetical protein
MLRALDKSGEIVLPPAKKRPRTTGKKYDVKWLVHDKNPIEGNLAEQLPLHVEIVEGRNQLEEFKSYLVQFHYLQFDRTIGENMKYIIKGCNGVPLACMLFGSAAWSCADRDKYFGWDKEHRAKNLMYVTSNTRYLILPWVNVFNLASNILATVCRRISADWERKYGHGLVCLETYVEISRFYGTCYKAANWIHVGKTTGRGRDGGHHHAILPEKDVYIYPLTKDYRKKLGGEIT